MTEETFTRELERRADEVHAAPLTFEAVVGRARQVRRRRRRAVAAGVAAAVVVAVAPFVVASGRDDSAPDPAPEPVVQGASVLHDGTLTKPDGSTVPIDVDNADVSQLVVLTDGRIVLATSRPFGIQVLSSAGEHLTTYDGDTNALTASAGSDAVGWVAPDLTVRVLTSGDDEPTTWTPMPDTKVGSLDAVVDAGQGILVGDGTTTTGTDGRSRVIDVNADGSLWAVQYPNDADPQFGCSGLYDPAADEVVAENCDTSGLRFSPDGQHLIGMRGDNNMVDQVDVFDLELRRVGSYVPDSNDYLVSRAAWADDTHVAVSVVNPRSNRWWLVSHDIAGGEPEVVVPPFDGGNPESVQEFVFSE
jgi:hypothetical protein